MWPPLTPVEAGSAKRASGARRVARIDAELAQETPALLGHKAGSIRQYNIALAGESIRKGSSKPAGHMIVAGAGQPQRLVLRADRMVTLRPARRNRHQGMNGMRHVGRGKPIIAMPSLLLDGNQPGFRQLAEMAACGLCGDAGMSRELARRQCLSAHKGREHVGARCIPDQACNLRYRISRGDIRHGRILAAKRYAVSVPQFGHGRNIPLPFPASQESKTTSIETGIRWMPRRYLHRGALAWWPEASSRHSLPESRG